MALRHRDLCDLILYELYWMAADANGIEDIAPNNLFHVFEDKTSSERSPDCASFHSGYLVRASPPLLHVTQSFACAIDTRRDPRAVFLLARCAAFAFSVSPKEDNTAMLSGNSTTSLSEPPIAST
jgi:hypothetical protein